MITDTPIRASMDTEGTGLMLFHGDLPYMVCMRFSAPLSQIEPGYGSGNQLTWEWEVDPKTRKVLYDHRDLLEIVYFLTRQDITWYLHNAKYDTRAVVRAIQLLVRELEEFPPEEFYEECTTLKAFNPEWYLDRSHDTALMAHAENNRGDHGLKSLGVKYCNIGEDDVQALQQQVEACYPFAEEMGWKIASADNCPLVVKKPNGGWWVMDMWLPHAVYNGAIISPGEFYNNWSHLIPVLFVTRSGGIFSSTQSFHSYLEQGPVFRNLCRTYCLCDCDRTYYLGEFLTERLKEQNLWEAYLGNQCQLAVAYSMEEHGLPTLMQHAESEQLRLNSLAKKYEAACRHLVLDAKLKLTSPQQVAQTLRVRFGVDIQRYTVDGVPTIDKDEVEELLASLEPRITLGGETQFQPLYDFLFYYMGFKKCDKAANQDIPRYKRNALAYSITTYQSQHTIIQNDRQVPISEHQSIVHRNHFDFNVGGTDTNRYSSNGAQNIGKGKNAFNAGIKNLDLSLRKLFGPDPGRKWYTIDGKQLQIVIAAYTSNEPLLREAIEQDKDLHDITHRGLAKALGWVYNRDDDGQRTISKNTNFCYLFGGGVNKLNETTHTTGLYPIVQELFPEAKKQIRLDTKFVKEHSYIMSGPYRIYIKESEPYAGTVNRIQCMEALIVKRAMRSIYDYLKGNPQYNSKLILQIHDEVVIDAPVDDDPLLVKWMIYFFEEAGYHFGIPCKADAKVITTNWQEGKRIN